MRFPNHVSVIWDMACMYDWLPIVLSVHDHLVPAPAAPPVPAPFSPAYEMGVPIGWHPGALLGDHKLTSTVYHNHVWFALDGHDCGHMIPHSCVPPTCTLAAVHMMLSSRKAKFTAGEVKANGAAVACCTMIDLAIVPTPMLLCGSAPLPIAGTGTAVSGNSLLVGMHWVDLLAGWVDLLVSALQTALTSGIDMGGDIEVELSRHARPNLDQVMGALGINPLPDCGSRAGGVVRLLGQLLADYHGDAQLGRSPISGPLGGCGASVTRDGASGDIVADFHGGVQVGGLAGAEGHGRGIRHADGSFEAQLSGKGSTIGGGSAERGVSTRDGTHWESMPTTGDQGASLPWSEGTFAPFL